MILVTGGTGLLGSHLLYSLVNSGKEVRAIKRASSSLSEVKRVFDFYSENADKLFAKIKLQILERIEKCLLICFF